MTKKHFTAIARSIKVELELSSGTYERNAIARVANALATDFACFNSNFDRQRFLTACGL